MNDQRNIYPVLAISSLVVAIGASFGGGESGLRLFQTVALPYIIPAITVGLRTWSYGLLVAFIFAAWSFPYQFGSPKTTKSLWLGGLSGVLAIAYYTHGHDYALRFQSREYFFEVMTVPIVLFLIAMRLLVTARLKANVTMTIIGNATLFNWLSWVAFPYMGELL